LVVNVICIHFAHYQFFLFYLLLFFLIHCHLLLFIIISFYLLWSSFIYCHLLSFNCISFIIINQRRSFSSLLNEFDNNDEIPVLLIKFNSELFCEFKNEIVRNSLAEIFRLLEQIEKNVLKFFYFILIKKIFENSIYSGRYDKFFQFLRKIRDCFSFIVLSYLKTLNDKPEISIFRYQTLTGAKDFFSIKKIRSFLIRIF
jgi:hypothetical protein